jgi:hypothetical protein
MFLFIVVSVCFLFCDATRLAVAREHEKQASAAEQEGEQVRLESDQATNTFELDLGPVVINEDGTMGRLKNWAELTQHERVAILRVVQARNEKRKAALKNRDEQREL